MTKKIMLIAPGESVDREWYPSGLYALRFVRTPTVAVQWTATDAGFTMFDDRTIGSATLRRYYSPGWKVDLEFYVDDALCVGSQDDRPIIPTGYVLPGLIHGRALEYLPLMRWKLNRRDERWELWPAGGEEYVAVVTREFMRRVGEEQAQRIIMRGYGVPLPDEAWRPKPPPEVPMKYFTPEQLLRILDGDG